jgi:hypothetical protein
MKGYLAHTAEAALAVFQSLLTRVANDRASANAVSEVLSLHRLQWAGQQSFVLKSAQTTAWSSSNENFHDGTLKWQTSLIADTLSSKQNPNGADRPLSHEKIEFSLLPSGRLGNPPIFSRGQK